MNEIHEKGTRTQKLTEQKKASNSRKSSIRCRVELLFGFKTNTMRAMYIRTIGIERVEARIALISLTYNMMRCVQLGKSVYNVFLQ